MLAKTLILGTAALLAAPLAGNAAADAPAAAPAERAERTSDWDGRLDFTLSPSGRAEEGGTRTNLSLRYGEGRRQSQHSRTTNLADLAGLAPADLARNNGPVRFQLVREAGTIDCTGTARGGGRAAGTCRFAPDEAFAADLDRRGIGRPDLQNQFHLAMAGVGRPLLDELARQGYPSPRITDLVALGIHGADVQFLRELDAAGHRLGSLGQLVAFRIHGVTPAFVREMAELGYPGLGPDDLGMRIHGVRPERLREFAAMGYRSLSAQHIGAFAIHGVTPAFVRDMAAAGYGDLTADQLVSLRIHGVRPDDARALNAASASEGR